MDRLIPQTPITFGAVIGIIVTVAVVALLVHLASGLAALTKMILHGPEQIVEHVSAIVHWLVILAAVLVAHRGLMPGIAPFLDGRVWVYDLVFLVFAVPPLIIVATRLYFSLDPMADLITDKIAGENPN